MNPILVKFEEVKPGRWTWRVGNIVGHRSGPYPWTKEAAAQSFRSYARHRGITNYKFAQCFDGVWAVQEDFLDACPAG